MKSSASPVYATILVRTTQASVLGLAAHFLFHWPLTGPHALGFFLTPVLCLYFVFVFMGSWSWGLPILTRLRARENAVALTFDDGPSPETTPRILDILRERQVRATFFVLGERVRENPDLVRRMLAEGHEVGIHAYCHQSLALASYTKVRKEIQQTVAALREAAPGAPQPFWVRPPYGFKSVLLPFFLRRAGFGMAAWSVNSRDYEASSPEQIADRVLYRLHPGAIVLLHDGPGNRVTADALPRLLDGLSARGCQCVPLR